MSYKDDLLAKKIASMDEKLNTDGDESQVDENTPEDMFYPLGEELSSADEVTPLYFSDDFAWAGEKALLSPSFARSGTAYTPEGALVQANEARYVSGKFGLGVMVEEGRTNYVYPSNLSTTPPSSGGGVSISMVTRQLYEQTQVRRVARTGTTTWAFAEWNAYLPSAQQYTVSVFIANDTVPSGNVTEIHIIEQAANPQRYAALSVTWGGTDGKTITGVSVRNGGGWTNPTNQGYELHANSFWRVWFTCPSDVNPSMSPRLRIVPSTSSAALTDAGVLVGKAQVEPGTYRTTHIPTTSASATRSSESLTLPTTGLTPTQGTIAAWVKVDSVARRQVASQWNRMLDVSRSVGGYGLSVWHEPTAPVWNFVIRNDSGVHSTTQTATDTHTPDGWHRIVIRLTSAEARLFIDGVSRAVLTNPATPSGFGAMNIGHGGGNYYLNAPFDNIVLDSVAWSDAQVAADYASNAPYVPTATTLAVVNFNGSLEGEPYRMSTTNFDWGYGGRWASE